MRNLKRIVVSGVAALMVPLVPANAVDGLPPKTLNAVPFLIGLTSLGVLYSIMENGRYMVTQRTGAQQPLMNWPLEEGSSVVLGEAGLRNHTSERVKIQL